MSDDLEALLRDHYRRAAEDIRPSAELVARVRNTARPKRASRWPPALAAAAAVVIVTVVTWGLLRSSGHEETPVSPPPATVDVTPTPSPIPTPSDRTPEPSRPPIPSPTRTVLPHRSPTGGPATRPAHRARPS